MHAQGINVSLCSTRYRSFSVADLRHPVTREEDALHSGMTEICLVPGRWEFSWGSRWGQWHNPRYGGLPRCSSDRG